MQRILGLDIGDKRIGMAVSDLLGYMAQPLYTLARKSTKSAVDEIYDIIKREGISKVVVGLPKNMDGSEGIQAKRTRDFSQLLLQKENSNIAILFTSNASDIALEISKDLENNNIDIDLISMHTIKPFDYMTLKNIINTKKYVFTIEEHSIIGGLGSVVSEYIAESSQNPVFKRFALPDEYSHYVGSQMFIREKFNFTAEQIIQKIKELI